MTERQKDTLRARIAELQEKHSRLTCEASDIVDRHDSLDDLTSGENQRIDNLTTAASRVRTEIAECEQRIRTIDRAMEAAKKPSNRAGGPDDVGGYRWMERHGNGGKDPWSARDDQSPEGIASRALDAVEVARGEHVPDSGREAVTRAIETDVTGGVARWALSASAPDYLSAFRKVIARPLDGYRGWSDAERDAYLRVEATRTAMSLTDANGGYMVPFTLDPSVILTNGGTAGTYRDVATNVTIGTDSWNGVDSSGVSAEWLAEGSEAADKTPTFGQPSITPAKLAAWVFGSYEVLSDSNFGSQVGMLFADAVSNLEGPAFENGDGSGKPTGLVVALDADTGSEVAAASDATLVIGDVLKCLESLPVRHRRGKTVRWTSTLGVLNLLRKMSMTTNGDSLVTETATGPMILGLKWIETSTGLVTDPTTASAVNNTLILGDFSKYTVVNRLGSTVLYDPMVKGSNGRPTGQAGYFLYSRVGGAPVDTNAFRMLQT